MLIRVLDPLCFFISRKRCATTLNLARKLVSLGGRGLDMDGMIYGVGIIHRRR